MTEAAVRCEKLVKRYGEVTAVDGLDLEVRRGECFGLLGPNGAGKTTTVEILEGLNDPTAGTVEVLGMRWTRDDKALRRAPRTPGSVDRSSGSSSAASSTTSTPPSEAINSAGVPSAITFPLSMMATRSQSRSASSM